MKTRIIYPEKIWFNKSFHKLSNQSQILAIFLISNENIGLSPIYPIKDLKIMFTLGITELQLEKNKKELFLSGLYDFYQEWVFIKNDFSYCDYFGRDRVMESKEKEQSVIPTDVSDYFKGLKTGYQEVSNLSINTKPINNNINNIYNTIDSIDNEELMTKIAKHYNVSLLDVKKTYDSMFLWAKSKGKVYKDYRAGLMNWVSKKLEEGKIKCL